MLTKEKNSEILRLILDSSVDSSLYGQRGEDGSKTPRIYIQHISESDENDEKEKKWKIIDA